MYDFGGDILEPELKALALDCIQQQRDAAASAFDAFRPREDALELVSEQELARVLEHGADIHGISSEGAISNVITFGASHIQGVVLDDEVDRKRELVDKFVAELLCGVFDPRKRRNVVSSGHFWYPRGSWMGWHTNSRAPGWRIYINYAEEPGKSFFRYRDPLSGKVHTLIDRQWNLRVFRVVSEKPLWHCVYSDTERFSLGYMIRDISMLGKLRRKFRNW
jgi:hypothetical protein